MAERKIVAATYFLFISPANDGVYKEMVCLLSYTFKNSTTVVDSTSFCGTSSSPGPQTTGIDFNAEIVLNPDTGRTSQAAVFTLWRNKTTIGWKIAPGIPALSDLLYYGTGFIADNTLTMDTSNSNFSGSLGLGSTPTQVEVLAGTILTLGTKVAGTLYTNGFYTNVPMTGGTGTGAISNITVSGGGVSLVTLVNPGIGYTVADSLSALAANIGGTGSGFTQAVATVA